MSKNQTINPFEDFIVGKSNQVPQISEVDLLELYHRLSADISFSPQATQSQSQKNNQANKQKIDAKSLE